MEFTNMKMTSSNKRRLVLVISFLFIINQTAAQHVKVDQLTVFPDACQAYLSGNLLLKNRAGKIPLLLAPHLESVRVKPSPEYKLEYQYLTMDTIQQSTQAMDWRDMVEANRRKTVTVIYETGSELDEISGRVVIPGMGQDFFIIRANTGGDFVITYEQIRQLFIEPGASYRFSKATATPMLELKINEALPVIPIELNYTGEGVIWKPLYEIWMSESGTGKMKVMAKVENRGGKLEGVLLKLAKSPLNKKDFEAPDGSHLVNIGRTSLPANSSLNVLVEEKQVEYSQVYKLDISNDGQTSLFRVLEFGENSFSAGAGRLSILDQEGNAYRSFLISSEEAARGAFPLEADDGVTWQYDELQETPGKEKVKVGGATFYNQWVDGKITIVNKKGLPVTVRLSKSVKAEEVEYAGQQQEAGNTIQILWEGELKPKESRSISFRYRILVEGK